MAISDLASTYDLRGQYDKAEQLCLEVVEGRKRVFGDDHAETLTAISDLGFTYRSRGKYDEAKLLFLEVVQGRKRLFGDDHAETLEAIANLASTSARVRPQMLRLQKWAYLGSPSLRLNM